MLNAKRYRLLAAVAALCGCGVLCAVDLTHVSLSMINPVGLLLGKVQLQYGLQSCTDSF